MFLLFIANLHIRSQTHPGGILSSVIWKELALVPNTMQHGLITKEAIASLSAES